MTAAIAVTPTAADRTSPAQRRTITLTAATHLAVDLTAGAFMATLPATLDRNGSTGTVLGLLIALYSITALGLQPILGRFADRIGLRRTVAVTAAVAALAITATARSSHLGLIALGTLVGGLASGSFHPAAAALARSVAGSRGESAVARFAAAGTIGLALGPIAGLVTVDHVGTPMSLTVLAVPAVTLAVALTRLQLPVHPTPQPPTAGRSTRQTIRSVRHIAAAATLVSIAATTIGSSVPLLIARTPGHSTTDLTIGTALASFSLSMAAGGLIGGTLVRRFPPTIVMRSGLLIGAAAGAASLALEPASVAFIVVLAVTGAAIGPTVPLLLVAAQDRLPDSQAAASGVVLGLANGVAGVAFLAISATHGRLGLVPGALVGVGGLVPAAVMVTGVVSTGRRSRTSFCDLPTCGCVVSTRVVAA